MKIVDSYSTLFKITDSHLLKIIDSDSTLLKITNSDSTLLKITDSNFTLLKIIRSTQTSSKLLTSTSQPWVAITVEQGEKIFWNIFLCIPHRKKGNKSFKIFFFKRKIYHEPLLSDHKWNYFFNIFSILVYRV